ncbi:hypothetical protein JOD43_003354 [Pullulanibacillus pueri]|uniref:Uncharacterized protein n=1 Tax=Pullulanibacillus pueri TaxID=1437324 RepID=A0A8J2ZXS6_9BACL|nr:hypothetical protein [Pullulanibacillus pueri]MBM7683175.1 hypothetical protein [Pullulanibacillus pueri]GGH85666.1 hypothetical protein GCM10007096_31590 [Pullulanibacillus pueri]
MTEAKPPVLVLGTYHMGDRGNRDVYRQNISDVKANKQQNKNLHHDVVALIGQKRLITIVRRENIYWK